MATFGIHFDGPITIDHKVSIRVLAKTYEHMQRAIDRAYLIETHGEVWKHARLKDEQYAETEFIAAYPRKGGIFLDAFREDANAIVDRIFKSVRPVFESSVRQGLEEHQSLQTQLIERRRDIHGPRRRILTFDSVAADPPSDWASAYSNRSVVKEIDQLVSQIAPDRLDGSTIDITLNGRRAHPKCEFNGQIARRFHKLAARRELGPAMVVTATIRSLDRGNRHAKPSGKILNVATQREVILHLSDEEDFDALHPYHNGAELELFVCPIVEALGFDLNGGDLMFLGVV